MKEIVVLFLLFLFSQNVFAQQKNNFEDWEDRPQIVQPAECNLPPSDAVVLFDGNSLDKWECRNGSPVQWAFNGNWFTVKPGEPDIFSKQHFGDCQLHVEWKVPDEPHENLNWGNSGIYLMGLYEVQTYDSYNDNHKIYYNGQAGSIYKQHSPLVNSSRPAGEWQTFDIVFTAPVFDTDKTLKSPATFTVFQNGVLIHNHVELTGATTHEEYTEYQYHEPTGPVKLQSHGSRVSYRNIWVREF